MKFWAQRNEIIHMTVNAWGEAGIVDGSYSKEVSFQIKMKVFPLPSQNINDLLSLLKKFSGWNTATTCAFREINAGRKGVQRYVLELSGPYAESFKGVRTGTDTFYLWRLVHRKQRHALF